MRIKLLNYGYEHQPKRAHQNDAGADVYSLEDYTLMPGETRKFRLGFGIILPDGFNAYIIDRSSLAAKGIIQHFAPIDSGYRGEVHAITTNVSNNPFVITKGDRIAQLIVLPTIIADFSEEDIKERGTGAFGSTGK